MILFGNALDWVAVDRQLYHGAANQDTSIVSTRLSTRSAPNFKAYSRNLELASGQGVKRVLIGKIRVGIRGERVLPRIRAWKWRIVGAKRRTLASDAQRIRGALKFFTSGHRKPASSNLRTRRAHNGRSSRKPSVTGVGTQASRRGRGARRYPV